MGSLLDSMRALATALILVASVINLLPAAGVLSAERLQGFYGVLLGDPNLEILLRHRAVLFAIVGSLLLAAAFHAALRPAAYAAGFVSMLSFVGIVWLVGGANAELRRVLVVDLVGIAALLGAFAIERALRAGESSA